MVQRPVVDSHALPCQSEVCTHITLEATTPSQTCQKNVRPGPACLPSPLQVVGHDSVQIQILCSTCLFAIAEDDTDMWRMCLTKHASHKALAAVAINASTEQGGAEGGTQEGLGAANESPIMPGGRGAVLMLTHEAKCGLDDHVRISAEDLMLRAMACLCQCPEG